MKTLTFNKRHVLFGMMVLSLGLTKSWLQTADVRGEISSASEAGETSPSAPIRRPTPTTTPGSQSRSCEMVFEKNLVGCDSKKAKVTLETKTAGPKEIWNSEKKQFERLEGSETLLFAKYSFECKSLGETLNGEVALDDSTSATPCEMVKNNETRISTDIAERVTVLREEKKLAEDIKNCVVLKDGDSVIDLDDTKYLGKKYACLGRKVRDENSDRKERREAFQHQVVDEIQEALLNSESDAERRAILAAIKGMKSEIGFDSALATDIKWLEKGANALASAKKNENLLALGRDSYLNPTNEYANDNAIDRIAWEFNIKTNTRLQKYSDTTKEMISDWSDLIVPIAIQAQTKQEDLVREFYGEGSIKDGINNDIGGADRSNGNDRVGSNPRNNNGGNQGTGNACPSRIVRCDTDITSLPLYQQNIGQQSNNGMPYSGAPTSTYGNRRSTTGMNGIPSSYQQPYQQQGMYQQPGMYQQRPPYQQQGMYQQPGMYQQRPPYQQGGMYQQPGMYQQRPPYQQGGMYQQPGMYQQRPPYQQGYQQGGMYNGQYPYRG